MNWIHHVADAAYVDNTDCGLTDFGNFTYDEMEVTCPQCLATMWVYSIPEGAYRRWWKAFTDSGSNLMPWEFLSLSENEDLFWQFMRVTYETKPEVEEDDS